MKQPGSNFVSWFGLAFLAALILVAAYFDMAKLEGFLIIVFILCLVAFLWGRFSLRKIELESAEEDCCGFPGQLLEVDSSLHNRKMLPLIWLDLSIPIGKKTCISPCAENGEEEDSSPEKNKARELRSTFLWVMPHQKLLWKQRALAVHRGVCRVEEVKLHSGDGFGLCTQTKKISLPCPIRFVVYPKVEPVDVSLILNNMSEMESAKNGFYTDRTLLENTRDYREGDSFKNINWRLLARKDEVQVNEYEKLTMRRVCFMPDMFSFTHIEEILEENERREERVTESEELENMFSLLASIIVKLHERGVLCSLVIPAIGDREEKLIIPENTQTQVMELLGALAEIEYDAEPTRVPVDAVMIERHKLGQIYVLSKNLKRSILSEDLMAAEEFSAISILSESPPLHESERSILTETDFKAL